MPRLPRPCLDCGELTTNVTRCPTCTARHKAVHKLARQAAMPSVNAGSRCCLRCGHPIYPGEAWDVDHHDGVLYSPSHRACNRRLGGGRA